MKQIIIHTENGLTADEEKAILKASKEAKVGKNVTKSMGVKEAVDYLAIL